MPVNWGAVTFGVLAILTGAVFLTFAKRVAVVNARRKPKHQGERQMSPAERQRDELVGVRAIAIVFLFAGLALVALGVFAADDFPT